MHEPDPIDGEYQPPDQSEAQPQKRPQRGRGCGTILAGGAVLLAKFKALLALLLEAKFLFFGLKLLASSWTFLLSLWLYVVLFGWQLGLVIVLVLAAHEFGHYMAYKNYGLAVRAPVFVPLMGAFTAGAVAPDLEQDAYIALAGPLTGLVLAGACYGLGSATDERFWFACADLTAFLNLFNMLPVLPFDGGRVIGAVWPPLWIAGVILFIAAAMWLHLPILFVAILALLGLPSMIAAFRGVPDPRAAAMTLAARVRVSVWYVAVSLALLAVLGGAQAHLPANGGAL